MDLVQSDLGFHISSQGLPVTQAGGHTFYPSNFSPDLSLNPVSIHLGQSQVQALCLPLR